MSGAAVPVKLPHMLSLDRLQKKYAFLVDNAAAAICATPPVVIVPLLSTGDADTF